MGEMAEYDFEQGMDQWIDHLAGHTQWPSEYCPYCEDDMFCDEKENHEN